MKKLLLLLLFAYISIQSPETGYGQSTAVRQTDTSAIDLNAPIPASEKVKIGTFENGLTYYIRQNDKPEDMLELRLVVRTGSLQEDDDQLGIAHFMEHMNFNGTEHFKKNELVEYLQSIGLRFGGDLNANTTFGRTLYILPLPTDDPEELEKGFQVLEDWAHGAILNHEMIDEERGIVLEELRSGLGAGKRMRQEYLPKIIKGSRYPKRLPIGTKESIENFDYAALERFYSDWYRPGLMAVIAVGDMDVDKIYQKIEKHFADIPARENPREHNVYSIANHKETYVAIASDKEAAGSAVRLTYMDKGTNEVSRTVGDLRNDLAETLFIQMINNRLYELSNSTNPPFISASSSYGQYWSPQKSAYQLAASTSENGLLEGLKALLLASKQVERYGFEPSELKRAKKSLLSSYKAFYKARKTRRSGSYIGGYVSNYLYGSILTDMEWWYEHTKKLIPTIKLKEVNRLIDDFTHKNNRTVLIVGPVKEDPVTEQEVRDLLAAVAEMKVEPYRVEEVREQLMREMPIDGSIIKTSTNNQLGTTTLQLSNGVKVVYKKTDFKDNQILMKAFGYGGTSLFSNEEIQKTTFGLGGLGMAGIAGLSYTDLGKVLTGKNASAAPQIGGLHFGFTGSATPEDFETMFELIYLYYTQLNKDEQAFQAYMSRVKASVVNRLSNPQTYFGVQLNKFIYGDNPRFVGFPTEEKLTNTSYELAYKKYKQLTDNANGLTFYFVGDIPVKELKDYSEIYLASLPSSPEIKEYKTYSYRPLSGSHKKVVYRGQAPKSVVKLMWRGEADYNPKVNYYMSSLGGILKMNLLESLREEESGVYSVGASGGLGKIPYGSWSFGIAFGCAPEHVENLIDAALAEAQKIIENGPSEEDLEKIKEQQLLSYKKGMKQNGYWLGNLFNADYYNTDPTAFLEFEERVNALTAEDIQRVAKKYLTQGHITAILYPEKSNSESK